MNPKFLTLCLVLSTTMAYTQTSFNQVNFSDSGSFFYQKGLTEKQNGRRLESLKNFEKASNYDASNKAIVNELASAYLDLRRYNNARETYKKLVELGEQTPANYKELMILSFQLKQNDDVIMYANKLKELDPSEKVNYYIGKANLSLIHI